MSTSRAKLSHFITFQGEVSVLASSLFDLDEAAQLLPGYGYCGAHSYSVTTQGCDYQQWQSL